MTSSASEWFTPPAFLAETLRTAEDFPNGGNVYEAVKNSADANSTRKA
jgi:hypothetical protein